MSDVIIPKINNNDTEALLVRWCIDDGAVVSEGDLIAVLETSKASFDLIAESAGDLRRLGREGERYEFGTAVAQILGPSEKQSVAHLRAPNPDGERIITRAARALIEQHGIDETEIAALGRQLVRTEDLESLIKPRIDQSISLPMSPHQQAIASTVTQSNSSIPHGFLLKKIQVGEALEWLKKFSEREAVFAGLPELLIHAVAELPRQFPWFFGAMTEDLHFIPSQDGNIGVTFDLGEGLYIPVVRKAESLSLAELAKLLMSYRRKAMRRSFTTEELLGGDISISLNMDKDTDFVVPLILPPQTAMLSLNAVQTEVSLLETGEPQDGSFLKLGLSYDHRVINGFNANEFLNAIKSRFEKPDF